jgi:hypothetical protein
MEWFSQSFNNREIASAIWLAIGAVFFVPYLLPTADLKRLVFELLKALFQPRLVVLFGAYALWVTLGAYLLSLVGLWTAFELKNTIMWFLFSGAGLLARAIQHDGDASFFGEIIRDQFRILAVFEFVVVAYSFALWLELLLVPFVTLLTGLQFVAEREEKFAPVKRLIDGILLGIAVMAIWHFVASVMENTGTFFSLQTMRDVLLPILLSAFSIPIYYLTYCYSRWENAVIRIGLKTYQSDVLKEQAKATFCRNLFLQPVLLDRAVRQFQTLPAKNKPDLDEIVAEIRQYERLKASPPTVPAEKGWCPYKAEQFLTEQELETSDYHSTGFDEKWFAESSSKYISDTFPREKLTYSLHGKKGAANALKLRGSFQITPHPTTGLSALQDAAATLAKNAIGVEDLPGLIVSAIREASDAETFVDRHVLSVAASRFGEANILDMEFSIRPQKRGRNGN